MWSPRFPSPLRCSPGVVAEPSLLISVRRFFIGNACARRLDPKHAHIYGPRGRAVDAPARRRVAHWVSATAACVTFAALLFAVPDVILLGVLVITLPTLGVVLHTHHHEVGMVGMVAGTAGSLLGALLAIASHLWLGHSVADAGMTIAMAAMAGMVGGTLIGMPALC